MPTQYRGLHSARKAGAEQDADTHYLDTGHVRWQTAEQAADAISEPHARRQRARLARYMKCFDGMSCLVAPCTVSVPDMP